VIVASRSRSGASDRTLRSLAADMPNATRDDISASMRLSRLGRPQWLTGKAGAIF
jgi:hypothetical protein